MLNREDYEEYCCSRYEMAKSIPTYRILQKLDQYLFVKDYSAAKRHLEYWLREANHIKDIGGEITVLNELVGFYRNTGNKDNALKYCSAVLERLSKLDNNVTKGTTLLNVATAYKAFDRVDEAIELYEKAKKIYEENLPEKDERLGGLYNNMAIALLDKKEYEKSEALFSKALDIMSKAGNSEPEIAITYCNMADLVYLKKGFADGKAEITVYMEKAIELLRNCNSEYGLFACEKCMSVFGYYGFSEYEEELKEKVKANERNRTVTPVL